MDFQGTVRVLKTLRGQKPSAQGWRLVREGLASKWEGVQALACQILGAWRGEEAVDTLREFLPRTFERKHGRAIRGVVVLALANCVRPEDVDWVLDLYFGVEGWRAKHELLDLVLALDLERSRDRLLHESKSRDADNRQAAMKAFANMAYPEDERENLLRRMMSDEDKEIRRGARLLLGRLAG